MSALAEDLALAEAATREAGAVAMRYFRTAHGRWEKGPGQVVTEADVAIDRLLRERLHGARPDYGWLSEESEDDRARLDRRRVWVVDPVDGTRSFAEGLPEFAVSVALAEDGVAALGLILNPATGEMFAAARGAGASLNGAPIRAAARDRLEEASVAASRYEGKRWRFADLLPGVEATTIGSLAYKLALVASGRFDGYLSWRRTHDWDVAAAAAILAEAGAVLTDADGAPIALNREHPIHEGVAAAGAALHPALLAATREARVEHVRGRGAARR